MRWVTRLVPPAITLALIAQMPRSGAQDGAQDPGAIGAAAVLYFGRIERDLYLAVSVNGQDAHAIVSFHEKGGMLYVHARDLLGLGVRADSRVGDPLIALGSVRGVRYFLDEARQSIDLTIDDSVRAPYEIERTPRDTPIASSGRGLVLNYDIVAQGDVTTLPTSAVAVAGEQRLFGRLGVLSNLGIATEVRGQSHYLRENTFYQYDDPGRLRSYIAGDTLSSSLAWTRSVRLGGVQVSRDFALQPGLITFPLPQFGGSAAVPSTVDLYINNMHQYSGEVPGGPFVINGPTGILGGALATVVVRDPLGHAVSTSLPIYLDNRLLAAGLDSYSFEAGMLRYDFGDRSFDYEGHAAASGTYRVGLSNSVTLESHAEGTAGLLVSGLGALVRLEQAGVLNLSIAGSVGSSRAGGHAAPQSTPDPSVAVALTPIGAEPVVNTPAGTVNGNGASVALGYQLVLPVVSITAQMQHLVAHYDDLAAVGGTPPPRVSGQVTASVPFARDQVAGASWVRQDEPVVGRSCIGAVWYSTRLSRSVSSYVNGSVDFNQHDSWSLWVGVSVDLGDRVEAVGSVGADDGHGVYGMSVSRPAAYEGGWEWALQGNRAANSSSGQLRGGYLGQYSELTASVLDVAGHRDVSVEGIGGILFMDGIWEAARHIGSGFALISTDGVPGVPVLHENRELGVTDGGGHLLVPDLNPYEHNSLAIDTLGLPAEDKIPVDHLDVTPRGSSGVLAKFPIERYRAASVTLVTDAGEVLPVGSVVHHDESGTDFLVGYDGMAFIEGLQRLNHLHVHLPDRQRCSITFNFPQPAKGTGLPNLGRLVCHAEEES